MRELALKSLSIEPQVLKQALGIDVAKGSLSHCRGTLKQDQEKIPRLFRHDQQYQKLSENRKYLIIIVYQPKGG